MSSRIDTQLSLPGRRIASIGLELASWSLGACFTLLLILLLGMIGTRPDRSTPAEPEMLLSISMPNQPPPRPQQEADPRPPPEESLQPLTHSVVSAGSSPALEESLPEGILPLGIAANLQVNHQAPAARIQAGNLLGVFKPKMDLEYSPQHVFQQSQVDRVPSVLTRKIPAISSRVRDDADELHSTFLLIVNANGLPTSIHLSQSSGNPEFDRLVQEALADWTFVPAMKNGRNVRCVLSQRLNFVWRGGSRFETTK